MLACGLLRMGVRPECCHRQPAFMGEGCHAPAGKQSARHAGRASGSDAPLDRVLSAQEGKWPAG